MSHALFWGWGGGVGGVFFFYMAHALLCGELLLHTPCCFIWRGSLTLVVLFFFFFHAGSLFSMPCSISYQEFVLHTLCKFMCGDFLIVCPVFFRVKSFFYVPHAVLCGKFLLQIYVPCISLSGEFLLHTPC